MADKNAGRKKPRIRKSAPTLRELSEAAQNKSAAAGPQRSRVKRIIKRPFSRLYRSDNRAVRALSRVFRPLGWLFRLIVPRYFINSWRELRQVTWPGRKETWRLTAAVFVFAICFGVAIYGVDYALDKIFKETVIE